MKNYDVNGGNNPADPLNTSNSMGGNNSWNLLGVFDDAIGSLLFGNPNASSEIMGELTGYNSQQREFAQQDYLLEKEQAFAKEQADPVYRMERMKAAGINPNIAASGISGGSPAASPSAPSVATNTQGAAQALNSAAGLVGMLSQNKLNEAEAENLNAQTREIHPNAEVDRALKVAQMYDDLSHIGVNEETAKSLSIANMYAPAEHAADLAVKWQSFRKMKAEYDTIIDEHNANLIKLKYLDQQIVAEVNLTNQRALEAEKNAAKAEEDTRFRKQENDFAEKWGFRREQPQDSILWSMFVEDPELYNKALGELTNRSFNSEIGRANAQNSSDFAYGRIGSPADLAGRIAQIGTNLITNAVTDVTNYFSNKSSAKELRQELQMVLNNAFDQLDNTSESDTKEIMRLKGVITDLQTALSLPNKELVKWSNTNWK